MEICCCFCQSVHTELHCVQRHGSTVMEEVNCTEAVSIATWSRAAGVVKTKTVSTLLLLRAQPGTPLGAGKETPHLSNRAVLKTMTLMLVLLDAHADSLGLGVLADLQFEDEGASRPGKARASTPQQASETVRLLCSLTSDPQPVGLNRLQSALNCTLCHFSQINVNPLQVTVPCQTSAVLFVVVFVTLHSLALCCLLFPCVPYTGGQSNLIWQPSA